ncbi:MAG: vitamin K epoxide reductase family protein [Patescibacteria group bacterium]
MDSHLVIFILSLFGIAESLYLNYEARKHRTPVCLIGDGCSTVWKSPYSKTFGISNEILGIIFYATLAVVEWMLFSGDTSSTVVLGEYLILFGGAVMACYFFYIQWRIIRAWCFWCSLSGIIVLAMILTRFFL